MHCTVNSIVRILASAALLLMVNVQLFAATTITAQQKQALQVFIHRCLNDLYNLRIEQYRHCIAKEDQAQAVAIYKNLLQEANKKKELAELTNKSGKDAFNEMTRQVVQPMVLGLRGTKKSLKMSAKVLATHHINNDLYIALVEVAIVSEKDGSKIDAHEQPFYFSLESNSFVLRTNYYSSQPTHLH